MSAPVLVLGGSGRLGRALCVEMERRGVAFQAPPHGVFDLADLDSLSRHELAGYRAVIDVAGFTHVDAAEMPNARALARRLNALAPRILAERSARAGVPFVYLSTDYVFDGTKEAPYAEEDAVHPLQHYGTTKLEGERGVTAAHPGALILRVSTLYGLFARPAYVDKIFMAAHQHAANGVRAMDVVERPVSSPTYAGDVAPALLDLLDRGVTGIVHVVNAGAASRLELARAVVELSGLGGRLAIGTRPEDPGSLARPAYSVLGTAKLRSLLGRELPPWKDALARYLSGGVHS